MWTLVKKNSIVLLAYLIPFLAFFSLYWVLERRPLDPFILGLQLFWMWILISGTISTSEKRETKNNGYKFLQILPLRDQEIVGAKFILLLIAVVMVFIYNQVQFSFFESGPVLMKLSRVLITLHALVCLILAGLIYVGVYKYGFSKMGNALWGVALGIFALMIILLEFIMPRIKDLLPGIVHFLIGIPLPILLMVVILTLYGYYGLMKAAVKAKIAARG